MKLELDVNLKGTLYIVQLYCNYWSNEKFKIGNKKDTDFSKSLTLDVALVTAYRVYLYNEVYMLVVNKGWS